MAGSSSQNYDNADLDAEDYEREQKEARQFIEQNGITGFDNYITERVSAWKNMPLNIAVTGFTGVGKSTLINTFRVITPEDEGAAKTSTTECTHKVECYPHSTNKNLLFWDLPGVGTAGHPRKTYLDEMQFERFDFVLIISGNRFTEDDLWLATTLKTMNKNFFFVRSKTDADLANAERDYPKTFKEKNEMTKIRNACIEHLTPITGDVKTVYLISGLLRDILKYEYGKLMDDLIENYPKLKRQALVLSLDVPCKEVIKAKATILRNQWKVTAALYATLTLPLSLVPGGLRSFDSTAYKVLFKYEKQVDSAIEALGLNSSAIEKLGNAYGIPTEKFSAVCKQIFGSQTTVKTFLDSIMKYEHQISNENSSVPSSLSGPLEEILRAWGEEILLRTMPGVSNWYVWKEIRAEWIRFVDDLEQLAYMIIDIILTSEAN